MLTEKEYRQALEILKARANYENVDAIICFKELIDEHFDNPPLEFEELKQGMWIWDNARKEWVKVEAQRETYTKIVECWVIGWVLLKTYEFEPNRFYRKKVE